MTRAPVRPAALVLAAILAAACAPATSNTRSVPEAFCETGKPVLVVRNDTGAEVEIVQSRIGSGSREVIAIVPSGRHEVDIRNEPGYSYSARAVGGGRIVASTNLRRSTNRFVTLERECRS